MKYTLKIVADTNDADYVTSMNDVTEADIKKLQPMFDALKAFKPYKVKHKDSMGEFEWQHDNNFNTNPREDLGEKTVEEIYKDVDKDTLEMFMDLCPSGEYGIHTIESIKVSPKIQWKTLFKGR